ncbi:MAG: class I SAM-dependent methyltransferase [Polyangiaceae bacterium]|nr:class I SAM-dependent methyltransferase [Polyangiaceae bacterium]
MRAEIDFEGAMARTAARYARATDRSADRHFTRSKLRRDPVTRALVDLASTGTSSGLGDVLDVGCGRGQLALFLLEMDAAQRVVGMDWDAEKVNLAKRAAAGLEATFQTADAMVEPLPSADTVLLIDVLHYLTIDMQNALLARAVACVRPGGRLVVREASSACGVRSALTLFVERISQAMKFNLGACIALRDVHRDLVPILNAAGMKCAVIECWRGTPFSNLLVVAERPT